jgi:hypothetical protein
MEDPPSRPGQLLHPTLPTAADPPLKARGRRQKRASARLQVKKTERNDHFDMFKVS